MSHTVSALRKGLVVDDDPYVRFFATTVLGQEGYDVISASDAGEALWLACRPEGALDFLVADYDLGPSTGLDIAVALRRMFPSLRVLIISGSHIPWPSLADDFLVKPFTAAALARRVHDLFENTTAPARPAVMQAAGGAR